MTPEWDRREASPSSSVGSDVSVADARFEGFGGGAAERRGELCEPSGARTRGLGAAAPAARRAPSLLRRLFSASAAPSTSGETLKTSSSLASVASAGSSPGDGSAPASESLCTSALLYSASVLRGEVHMQSDSECAMLIAADTAHRHAHAAAARAAEAAARRGGAQHQRPDGENHSASTQHTKPEASRASTDPLTIPSSHARTVVRGGRVVCDNEVLCGQCKFCEEVLGKLLIHWQQQRAEQTAQAVELQRQAQQAQQQQLARRQVQHQQNHHQQLHLQTQYLHHQQLAAQQQAAAAAAQQAHWNRAAAADAHAAL